MPTKLIIHGPNSEPVPRADPALIKAIVRAHDWVDRLISGKCCSLADIAAEEGVSRTYIYPRAKLAFLAPDIVESILDGRQPVQLNAEGLIKSGQIPIRWQLQREALGFTPSD